MSYALRDLSKSKIFLFCLIIFISGIAVASFLPSQFIKHDLFWFSGAVFSLAASFIFWSKFKIRAPALFGLFLFLAFWRYSLSIPNNAPDKVSFYNGKETTLTGKIVNEPEVDTDKTRLVVEAEKIKNFPAQGKILVTTGLYPEFSFGDQAELKCKLKKPESENFPYDRYLARYDIYSVCYYPKIISIVGFSQARGGGWRDSFYNFIFKVKNIARTQIEAGLSEPEAGLARGFILGDLKNIDSELSRKFAQIGISHIVAISGENITIVVGIIMALCLGIGLNRKSSFYLSTFFLILYIILVGAPASAMRAGLMGFLVIWALYLGRLNKIVNAFALAAAIMLFFNPKLLRDDIGFQLSFLALISIAYVYPIFKTWFEKIKIPELFGIREGLAITVAAQIMTLPVTIYNFGQISLIAIFANLFVLWTLPPLMAVLPISILASFLFKNFEFLVFFPARLLLNYVIKVAEYFSRVPFASAEANSDSVFFWAVYYALIFIFVFYLNKKRMKASST